MGSHERFDAVVVGAGFAGMYMLHRLRGLGLSVRVVEAATDVGGTWYWNRYPGARCDVASMEYSYSFSPELQQEWRWSEVFSGQPEILEYARHVADRFDLRGDISFETKVLSAIYDDTSATWTIETDGGDFLTAEYCIMATGSLSATNTPDLVGLDRFAGPVLHTGHYPKDGGAIEDKRVGIIGTGSSGVQAIPVLATQAGHLHVFQRTPVFTFPSENKPMRTDIEAAYKASYDEIRDLQRHSPTGFSGFSAKKGLPPKKPAEPDGSADGAPRPPRAPRPQIRDTTAEERRAAFERYGFGVFTVYPDIYKDLEANELACELYRDHIRSVVTDPDVAEKLAPKGYPLGCKRQVLDSGYYETFNRPNVTLVDLMADPLVEITETGVRTASTEIELDVLVLATGFDAMTGALDRIDIRGRHGQRLRDKWADGPRAYLGLQMAGFPNLFTITGPGSPSVLSNVIVSIEQHVDWISDCLVYLRDHGLATIEPDPAAEDAWLEEVRLAGEGTMYTAPTCSSWYIGANIEGKPRGIMPYVGGVGRYRARCEAVVANGYEGFVLS